MIVYCLGMQSSGSTWLYNVVRDLMNAAGLKHTAMRAEMYQNFMEQRAARHRNGVLRGHNVQSALIRILNLNDVKTIMSFRDPRDAVTSFLQRFGNYGAEFLPVCNDIARNLASLVTASQQLDHLSFFYEDKFTESPQTVRKVAEFIGLPASDELVETIFDKYRAAKVKDLMAKLDELPESQRFVDPNNNNVADRATSFHRTHISDMRVGKWQEVLTAEQQEVVGELFGDYAQLLRDRTTGQGRTPGRTDGVQPLRPFKIVYSGKSALFAPANREGRFVHAPRCRDVHSPLGVQVLGFIYLPESQWDFRLRTPGIKGATARLCQNGQVIRTVTTTTDVMTFRYLNQLHDHALEVHLTYDAMEADIAADRPPPQVILEATLRQTLDDLYPS